jgi:hypothetical protein
MQEDKPLDEEDSGDEEEQCSGFCIRDDEQRHDGNFKWFVVWISTTITTQPHQRLYQPKTRDDDQYYSDIVQDSHWGWNGGCAVEELTTQQSVVLVCLVLAWHMHHCLLCGTPTGSFRAAILE